MGFDKIKEDLLVIFNANKKSVKEKCKECKFKNRLNKTYFPCNKCDSKGNPPLTCVECRSYPCTNKKGIRPCKNFEWD